jgi:hypothetical protein
MKFRTWLFVGLLFLVLGYFVFEVYGVLLRPRLVIDEPHYGERVHTTYIAVAGRSSAGIDVWVNGHALRTDNDGFFKTTIGLFPGYNPIEVRVKNRFGYEQRELTAVVLE